MKTPKKMEHICLLQKIVCFKDDVYLATVWYKI